MAKYEHGENEVLRELLLPAIRDYEDRLRVASASFYKRQDETIEQALSRLVPADREYYLETESWLRDFKTMLATVGK
jgi:hypothetical protein